MRDICTLGVGGRSIFMRVNAFHQPGETVRANALHTEMGGKGMNQAVAAARLGADTAFIGAVGRDEDGDACKAALEREGVTPLLAYKETGTALAVILTDAQADNRVTVYPGAAALLSEQDTLAHADTIQQCRIVLLNGEIPPDALRLAVRLAREGGARVMLNPAPASDACRDVLPFAECVTPNRQEALALFGGMPTKETVRRMGLRRVLVTLGAEGALLVTPDSETVYPAPHVQAADSTGAGDVFSAALCVCLSQGAAYESAISFALHAAALSVTREHVMSGMPTLSEVTAFMR